MTKKFDNVRALVRGLDILRHVNGMGATKVADIAKALDIPRPTVHRLLRTLEEAGYIFFTASDARVRVSPFASGLGDNSSVRSKLCHAAAPLLANFTDQHNWPIDLSIYSDLRMVVEETTHWRSPLSVDTNMAGSSLPMLRSSAGRAYLAFCDEQERAIILRLLEEEGHVDDRAYLETSWAQDTLEKYRVQGFASRGPRTFRPKTSSIAVPIIFEERVIGCLSMIWITTAFSITDAAKRYSQPLKNLAISTANAMEKRLQGF